jgi:type II restriction/modification system DNA methylase subunit YeeA
VGIELNEYAAELARVTVWIGELQWRIEHGYAFKTNPVLEPLDHIECRDALLQFPPPPLSLPLPPGEGRGEGLPSSLPASNTGARARQMPGAHTLRFLKSPPTSAPPTPLPVRAEPNSVRAEPISVRAEPVEATCPKASVVIGNPLFLGDKKMRAELGDAYTEVLRKTYEGRVPGGADLVCYWFEKARQAIEAQGLGAAGLVATNVIARGANRKVLDRITTTAQIFEVWDDQPWVNEGATLRVSMVCFGHSGQPPYLNGKEVTKIYSDLKAQGIGAEIVDLTALKPLTENANSTYFGFCLAGPFKIPSSSAAGLLRLPNPHSQPNSDVLKPIYNGSDITGRWCGNWVIDFGARMSEGDAAMYEQPFTYITQHVLPDRAKNNRASRSKYWWRHGEARPGLRQKLINLSRYIATVETKEKGR